MTGPAATLRFHGANRQATGSRYLLETSDVLVLIDCGMFQQREELFRNWEPSPGPPETVDHMLLAHRNRPRAACAFGGEERNLGVSHPR